MPHSSDKAECLRHYTECEPQEFVQYDGFNPPTWPVGPGSEDDDDDEVWMGRTWELMTSSPRVRVLIPPDADGADVVRLLTKIAAWIERDGVGVPPVRKVA